MEYFLGLDNGGTTTKAALYDRFGRESAVASSDTNYSSPRPGYVERDMDTMWRDNCGVIRSLIERAGVAPENIKAVGLSGHGKGLYLWGKDDRPVRAGILSADNRAVDYQIAWKNAGVEEEVFSISYQHILACQPPALLMWMKDHECASVKRIRWIFSCKDYIRFRLTGNATAEITDSSGCNLLNLETGTYDERLLELFDLKDLSYALPPLCRSTDVAGAVSPEAARETGLLAGTPVAGGVFDIDACALAVDAVARDRVCMVAGTWSINEYVSSAPVLDGTVLMNSLFAEPRKYLIEECSPTSAGNNEWFIRQFFPEYIDERKRMEKSKYSEMDEWVDSLGAEEFCPIFHPFIMGSNMNPYAMGSFVGADATHTRKHFLRSVYEGVAFSHRYHLERLLKTRTDAPRVIRLAGGVARSAVWTQMFADVLGFPVETVAISETGTAGAAMVAAVAVSEYSSLSDAAAKMCSVAGVFTPRAQSRAAYEKRYAAYLSVGKSLDAVWKDLRSLRNG